MALNFKRRVHNDNITYTIKAELVYPTEDVGDNKIKEANIKGHKFYEISHRIHQLLLNYPKGDEVKLFKDNCINVFHTAFERTEYFYKGDTLQAVTLVKWQLDVYRAPRTRVGRVCLLYTSPSPRDS